MEDLFKEPPLPLPTFDDSVSPSFLHSFGSSLIKSENLGSRPATQTRSIMPNNEKWLTGGITKDKSSNQGLCL